MNLSTYSSVDALCAATDAAHEHSGCEAAFYGNVDLANAKRLAIEGWPEGLAKVEQFRSRMASIVTRSIERQELVYDVTGLDFDMGHAITGVPECWYDFAPIAQQRSIRIAYTATVSHDLPEDMLMMRGAAICCLIDTLEANNIRVEFDVFGEGRIKGYDVSTLVNLKRADQPLDIGRLAFAIMHPGMARKLIISNQFGQLGITTDKSNCIGVQWPEETLDVSAYDLAVTRGYTGLPRYSNMDDMLRWIKKQLSAFGVHLSGSDDAETAAAPPPPPPPPPKTPQTRRKLITAKFPGKCPACGGAIARGDSVRWDKAARKVYHPTC